MIDVNSELMRMSDEIHRLKQHKKETKRLIKDCFADSCTESYTITIYQDTYKSLIKHLNKRKV